MKRLFSPMRSPLAPVVLTAGIAVAMLAPPPPEATDLSLPSDPANGVMAPSRAAALATVFTVHVAAPVAAHVAKANTPAFALKVAAD